MSEANRSQTNHTFDEVALLLGFFLITMFLLFLLHLIVKNIALCAMRSFFLFIRDVFLRKMK